MLTAIKERTNIDHPLFTRNGVRAPPSGPRLLGRDERSTARKLWIDTHLVGLVSDSLPRRFRPTASKPRFWRRPCTGTLNGEDDAKHELTCENGKCATQPDGMQNRRDSRVRLGSG